MLKNKIDLEKSFSIFIVIFIIIAMFNLAVIASAAAGEEISIGSGIANPGETIVLPITIANATDVEGMTLEVTYDKNIVTIINIKANNAVPGSSVTKDIDEKNGTATIELTNPNNITAISTTPVIDITFQAENSGTSTIDLQNVELTKNSTDYAPGNVNDGEIRVNSPPVFEPIGSQNINENEQLTITINAIDTDGDSLAYSARGLPQGATFDQDTRTFQWTPTYQQAGTYDVEFVASDGNLEDNETIAITVNDENRAPELESIGDKYANENTILEFTVNATDPDYDSLTYSANNLPQGATFNQVTKTFQWTPTYQQAGTHDAEFVVSDGELEDNETITITVNSVNRPPELESIGDKNVNENTTIEFAINATDPDDDSLTYSANTLPQGATFNQFTKTFQWIPTYQQAGTHNVEFVVSDGELEDSETITITVNSVNRAPELESIGDKYVNENIMLEFTVSATDPDGNLIAYSANNLPQGATFNQFTRTFRWTPTYQQAGTHNVEFVVSDGELEDNETITITVNSVNRPPEMESIGDKDVNEGIILDITINATDPDSDSLTYSANGLPEGATFDQDTRTFLWTPTYQQAGTYDVEFSVSDGELEDNEIITIIVNDENRAPTLSVIGSRSIDENTELEFTISGSDPDNDELQYHAIGLPPGASLNPSTGLFIWTPDYDQAGMYHITFWVTDGTDQDGETITITVNDINRAPALNYIGPKLVTEGQTLTIVLVGNDPDGDKLTYTKDATFGQLNDNIFTWIPGYEDSGTHTIKFEVSDGEFTDSKTVTITVNENNRAPELEPISDILIEEMETVTIQLNAHDPDGDHITYSKSVSFGTLDGDVFTWTPGYGDSGFHYIDFTVTDGRLYDTERVLIAVGNENRPPVLEEIGPRSIDENDTLTFRLNASDLDGDTLTYSAVGLPTGANLNPSTGLFTWTPGYDEAGIYIVDFSVKDSEFKDVEQVTITVNGFNRAPSLEDIPEYTVNETGTVKIILNAYDPDNDPLTYSKNVSFGTIVGNEFTWTPGYNESGIHQIEFVVTDGSLNDTKEATIVVNDINMPPTLQYIGSKSVNENSQLTFTLSASDGDGDELTYSAEGLPNGASLNNSTGLFTWKPTYDQAGTYSVEFKVTDGIYEVAEAISITVKNYQATSGSSGSSSGGGGGGGGGGSQGTGEAYENILLKDYTIRNVAKDIEISFEFKEEENSISHINVTTKKNAGQIKAVVEVLKGQSSMVKTAPSGGVYQNMNIGVGDTAFTTGGFIANADVFFKVDRAWIQKNEVDESSIRLCRYNNNRWNKLPTEKIGEDEEHIYFKANTPGFSPFVITGDRPADLLAAEEEEEEIMHSTSSETFSEGSVDIDTLNESATDANETAAGVEENKPEKTNYVNLAILIIGLIGVVGNAKYIISSMEKTCDFMEIKRNELEEWVNKRRR